MNFSEFSEIKKHAHKEQLLTKKSAAKAYLWNSPSIVGNA